MKERMQNIIIIVLSVMLFSVWQAYAGNPGGPVTAPDSTSSYTLNDIYARLDGGTAGAESTFTESSVAAGTGTMHTLNEIMGAAPTVDDTNGTTPAEVATGKTFWGLTTSGWGLQTGTASLGGGAGVPKTGQTTCYDGSYNPTDCTNTTGQDGNHQAGIAWPNPRFTDNGDGTVTDNLTGLIWLKNANCTEALGGVTFDANNRLDWQEGLNFTAALANGACGLNDGSTAGQWRLPNRFELESLLSLQFWYPALSNTAGTGKWTEGDPFTSVQSFDYWSSSTNKANVTRDSWSVSLSDGSLFSRLKTNDRYVWPVRGGQ